MSKSILIQNFPLPPSENKLYRNVPGVGRVSTKELKDYKENVRVWALSNKQIIDATKDIIFSEWNNDRALKIDCYFVLKHERIYTKDGRPKKLDASNFIKACHDQLALSLGIDDRYFFCGHFEKVSGENECVIVFISVIDPMTSVEVLGIFTENKESDSIH